MGKQSKRASQSPPEPPTLAELLQQWIPPANREQERRQLIDQLYLTIQQRDTALLQLTDQANLVQYIGKVKSLSAELRDAINALHDTVKIVKRLLTPPPEED